MNTRRKVIVQFRKDGKKVTTKTVGSETEDLSDFEAVLSAENILQELVDRRKIPESLLDYDIVRLNNIKDIPVSGVGRNKAAFSILSKNRTVLSDAQVYLKR